MLFLNQNQEYLILLVLIIISFFLGFILYLFSFKIILKNKQINKLTIYECGFEAFIDIKIEFDVRFYLVGILFIIFDLEIIFIFPWIIILNIVDLYSLMSMSLFLLILIIIFIYEWCLGVLNW